MSAPAVQSFHVPDGPETTPFDVCGPLPAGTTVLEASAGTGKTYTIAALVARFVAEGEAELPSIMMVTFGRMATDELRQRVRERLVDLERHLAAARASPHQSSPDQSSPDQSSPDQSSPDQPTDPVTALLLDGCPAVLAARHARVRRALTDFDTATIATTHEFAGAMLAGLGVLGDGEPDATFVESLSDLVQEVATDAYLRHFAGREIPPALTYPDAVALAQTVVEFGPRELAPAVPIGEPLGVGPWQDRLAFAREVRAEVARRKERGRLFSYDDLLTRLQRSLHDPDHGQAVAQRLRGRYAVVLVDEFQDTDPVQWDILRTAFAGHRTLVLIGDPKQAIYAFRGADVHSYLAAAREADRVQTLSTNFRSDAAVVAAIESLLAGAPLGDSRIVARPVAAAHAKRRLGPAELDGVDLPAPLRLRVLPRDPERSRLPRVGELRPRVVADLVGDVSALLAARVPLRLPGRACVQASDVAVLVHRNKTGEVIREALCAAGVPAVLLGAASVFDSELSGHWLTLLRALEQPRSALIREVALTPFVGWSLAKLAGAREDDLTGLTATIRSWARAASRRGVAALLEVVASQTRLAERLLAHPNGERQLTDLRHVGQLLHAVALRDQLGIAALTDWLRERIREARGTTMSDRTRRLETEAQCVSVLTVHRSKGLEFPVVYVPELWDRYVAGDDKGNPLVLPNVLDVGGTAAPGRAERFHADVREKAGEDLRLGYVALTRAQCQVVTWWAPTCNTEHSALQRFLHGARSHPVDRDPLGLPSPGPGIVLERVGDVPAAPDIAPKAPARLVPLTARVFDRALDTTWRRTSYSALTAAAHGLAPAAPGVGSEATPTHEDDEMLDPGRPIDPADPAPAPGPGGDGQDAAVAAAATVTSPMADLPGGTAFGSVVHAILEDLDPAAANLPAALREAAGRALSRQPHGELGVEELVAGLEPALRTPLGPLAGDRALGDITISDRLAELDFELPLAGGDAARGPDPAPLRLSRVAALLRHHLPGDDPLRHYPAALERPELAEQTLRGYLTGSIDAVLRLPSGVGPGDEAANEPGGPRYLVVDYKTNVLGGAEGQPLTVAGYRPDRLAQAMIAAHYPLQALLYSVALHRFLRWRQPGYEPDRHLGGVLYLFLRGMVGPNSPRQGGVAYGVFSWRPPAALIRDLSDLLDTGGIP